ncbi:phytanoyl-CoA dioxygenase family protein [Caballeronia novacaledonica]|uniref:Phytanoyl-CoA dioxygenase (PhyH) n=1 Tax=Caballeronia novacaledonica TaxID=1544861 RepID=A0AA37MSK1_9BURK|nr:phytanoyl-CoA dioxygenase family protein [Caballeronia novacaledonica]GJH26024.1 hypothetical protein CBA19CS42_15930 [Caballeronia novacaledonica]
MFGIKRMFGSRSQSNDRRSIASVAMGDATKFGGIVEAEVIISSEALANSVLSVSAPSAPEATLRIDAIQPGQTVRVRTHFHILPNGEQQINFELEEPDGAVSTECVTITVDHVPGLAEETAHLLKEANAPLFFTGPCDSKFYPYDQHTAWFDRPDADSHIDGMLARSEITSEEAKRLRQFVEQGFMIVEGLIDDELVDAVNAEIDDAVATGYQGYTYGTSQRIEHLHYQYPSIRKLWLDARHRRYADLIFGASARPCQTLTYVFGSQQDAHSDLVHLTPFPAGYMCGTWIALQDVVPDSGELVVYPGSHRERRVYLAEANCKKVANGDWSEFGRTVCASWAEMLPKYEPVVYRPEKGTVLIWHENLLHAGSGRNDKALERRSIVIHSFADGAVAYYDSTGLHGSAVAREALTD